MSAWLVEVAATAGRGEVTLERGLADGAFLVGMRWPSERAWREHALNIVTLAAMVLEDRAAG